MENYTLTIRFDNEDHSLSSVNGLPISTLGELLVLLGKAVGLKEGDNLTLSGIKGNCYALDFYTDSESIRRKTERIHRQIAENDCAGFNPDQRKYVSGLMKIIGGKYRVNVYDELKSFNYRIATTEETQDVDFYFEVEDVYGVITFIGSSNMDSAPSIKLSGEGYDIHVNSEQERRLIRHFKKDRLLLTIRKKVNFQTEKTESATLIDFEVAGDDSERFFDRAEKLKASYGKRGLFPKVKDSSLSVRKLRGENNPVNSRRHG
jgi:hypothetical protein